MGMLLKIIRNPIWTVKRIKEKYFTIPNYRKKHLTSFQQLLKDLDYDFNDFMEISDEFMEFSAIHEFVNQQFRDNKLTKSYPPERISWGVFLYFLIRKKKPKTVIETGCWYGNSSVCILAALEKNRDGKLFTIDLPAYFSTGGYYDVNPYLPEEKRTSSLPEGMQPGFLVPEFLRKRWSLILGPTSEKLSPLLKELGKIDFFLHDSLHSNENMNFEFNLAYQYLKNGGILASDNIDWNDVFKDFSKNKRSYSYLAYYESPLLEDNFGIIIKG